MRTLPNDPVTTDIIATGHRGRRNGPAPERRCVLTGVHGTPDQLIRLALGPDGKIAPDVLAKAPGRGAWIAVDRAALENALAKGKLKAALSRAFKTADLTIPATLAADIDMALRRATLDRLGLESRAGNLLAGADKIDQAARAGAVVMLLHASDAGDDGRRKRDQSWRVGLEEEGSGRQGIVLPVDRDPLSVALGKANAVHIAITDDRAAHRVAALLNRWRRFGGYDKDAANTGSVQDEIGRSA